MKTFLVAGLSSFGIDLAKELSAAGQQVVTIDLDEALSKQAQGYVQIALVADARNLSNIRGLSLGPIDAAVICLGGDSYGALQTILNFKKIGIPEIIVKVANEEQGQIAIMVGATKVILPEKEMAERISMKIGIDNAIEILTLGSGVTMAEFAVPRSLIGKTLIEADLGRKFGVQILAVKELLQDKTHVIPQPGLVLKDSDILIVTGDEMDIANLRRL